MRFQIHNDVTNQYETFDTSACDFFAFCGGSKFADIPAIALKNAVSAIVKQKWDGTVLNWTDASPSQFNSAIQIKSLEQINGLLKSPAREGLLVRVTHSAKPYKS